MKLLNYCHRLKVVFVLVSISQFASAQNVVIELNDSIKLEMVFVEGGSFMMGTDKGKKDAHPAHLVKLDDFYVGKFEFTQEQWIAIAAIIQAKFHA